MSQTMTRPAHTAAGDDPPPRRSSLALWCVHHRWLVVILAALVLAGGAALMAGLGIRTIPSNEQLVGDSAQATRLVDAADFGTRPTENVVVSLPAGRMSPAQASTLGRELTAAYEGVQGVHDIGTPFPGKDGRSLVLPVALDADTDDATATPEPADVVAPVLEATDRFRSAHPGLDVGQFGEGSVRKELNETISGDFRKAEMLSLPITLLILLVAFGAVLAAGVPLVLGMGSVGVAFGLTALASHGVVTVDSNAQSLILLIGLAVGVDYALFYLRRTREERSAGHGVRDSIGIAGATAGRAVVISGLTVVVAMSGMLVAGGLYTSLALGAMLVVLVAALASATVLPAMLGILGDKVDALRLPFTRRRAARAGSLTSAWGRLAGRVCRRPIAWAAVTVAVLVGLALPALGMKTSLGGPEMLPKDLRVGRAYEQLKTAVPTEGTVLTLVVKAPAADAARVGAALRRAAPAAAAMPHVSGVEPAPQVSTDRTVTRLAIGVDLDSSSADLPTVVDTMRDVVVRDVRADLAGVGGLQVHVGGEAASTDLTAWMDQRLPWVVGFVLLLTLAVMLVSFGSVWLALATVTLNVLSVGAAYGIMTMVFQGTWAQGLLDFTSVGSIAAWLPLLMFVVLFGLSMDYHVFVTSRVREARDAGADARLAVRTGVARSAGVVTSAAAVMVAVFAIFGGMQSLEMKQLGVGLATAILLDATLVRGVLLPATLAMLGDRAHRGPAWLPTIHH